MIDVESNRMRLILHVYKYMHGGCWEKDEV